MTDWVRNVLTVSGPAAEVARFRHAARGTNAAPWHLDLDHEEARLLAPMAAAGIEARLLARDLREAIAAHHDRVLAGWAGPGRCPLDLHRLIPIPPDILHLGERAAQAESWLWTHWGTTQKLRNVRAHDEVDRRRRRTVSVIIEFDSADWTPWQAILRLRRDWTAAVRHPAHLPPRPP